METMIFKKINDLELKMDYYEPKGSKKFVSIVFLHGGALMFGARDWVPTWLVEQLNNSGYGVYSMDYRLLPETNIEKISQDVKDGVKFVQDRDEDCAVVVMGQSSGGYLALLAGICENLDLDGVISLSGYSNLFSYKSDLPPFDVPTISHEEAMSVVGDVEVTSGDAASRWKYQAYLIQNNKLAASYMGLDGVDSDEAVRKQMYEYCPIKNVTCFYPKTLLIHGDSDTDVSYMESVKMHETIGDDKSTLLIVEGKGHEFLITGDEPWADLELKTILKFLDEVQ